MAEGSSGESLRKELKGHRLSDVVVSTLIQYGLTDLQKLQFFTEEDFEWIKQAEGIRPFHVQELRCLQQKLTGKQMEMQGGQALSRPGILMQDVHVTVDTMQSHSTVFGVKSVLEAGEGGQAAALTPVQASLSHSSLHVDTIGPGSNVALQNISMARSATMETLENLIATTRQEMATQCPHGYVETPALQKVLDCLHKPGVCLILGLPGHGKSSLALQAMARLAFTENMIPVHLTDPLQWNWIPPPETRKTSARPRTTGNEVEDFQSDVDAPPSSGTEDTGSPPPSKKSKLSHDREKRLTPSQSHGTPARDTQTRQGSDLSAPLKQLKIYVALIDDSFGKGNFDQRKYDGWKDKFSHLEAKVRDGQVKLILVSRTHIYQNCKDSLVQHALFTLTEKVDLNDQKLWTRECLESILKSFLSHHKVDLPISSWDMDKICRSCQNIGFPQCCFYFVTNKYARRSGLTFFEKPLEFLRSQFQTMRKEDRKAYIVLILTLMEGGIILFVHPFSDSLHKNFERIQRLMPTDGAILPELNEVASRLVNVYLSRGTTPGSFTFCHQTVWDCLTLDMFEADFESTIETCSAEQLSAYIRTEVTISDRPELLHVISEAQWPLLAARLIQEMASGDLKGVLKHPCLRDNAFRQKLESVCPDPSLTRQILLREFISESKFSLPVYDQTGCTIQAHTFSMKHKTAIGVVVSHLPSLARKLIESDIFRDLLVQDKDLVLKEVLESACLKSDWELIQLMIEKKALVTGTVALAAISTSLSEDKIEQLIHRMTALPSEYQELVLHALAVDKLIVFLCLMYRMSQTLSKFQWYTLRGEDLLHITASCGSTRILQNLLGTFSADKCPQFLSTTDLEGSTVLHRALESGSYTVVPLLLRYRVKVNVTDRLGRYPLHLCACSCKNIKTYSNVMRQSHTLFEEALKQLIQMTHDINAKDNSGSTPLHVALQKGNTTLASLLVHSEKVDLNLADVTHRTALHWYVLSWEALIRHSSCGGKACQAAEPSRLLTAIVNETNDVNRADDEGQRPLLTALREGHADAADILLTHGADPNLLDFTTQENALHWCIKGWENIVTKYGKEKSLALLNKIVAQTRNINRQDAKGRSPLEMALNQKCYEVAAVLLEHISNVSKNQQSNKPYVDALFRYIIFDLNSAWWSSNKNISLLQEVLGPMSKLVDSTGRSLLHILSAPKYVMFPLQETVVVCVKMLLQKSPGILNKQDQEGNSALHVAAAGRNDHLMHLLLQHGASTDLVDGQGRTPLHVLAARCFDLKNCSKQMELWEKMLTASNINIQDRHSRTALHVAASFGNTALLKLLVEKGGKTDLQDDNGQTVLRCLFRFLFPQIDEKCFEVETEILRWKRLASTVNFRDVEENNDHQEKWTQLVLAYLACCHWHKTRTELVDASGQTVLHFLVGVCVGDSTGEQLTPVTGEWDDECKEAWRQLSSRVLHLVNHQRSAEDTILNLAVKRHDWSLVDALLSAGARADLVDGNGLTPLHCFSETCIVIVDGQWKCSLTEIQKKVVKQLVQAGNVINVQDSQGRTALHVAASTENWDVMKLLLDSGAKADVKDKDGNTAIHCFLHVTDYFTENKNLVLKQLIEAMDDVNVQDSQGRTVLHVAASIRNWDVMKLLLDSGAKADIKDKDGRTAFLSVFYIFCAFDQYEKEMAKMKQLVETMDDVNVQDSQSTTALHVASSKGNWNLMKLLLDSGAKADMKDKDGRTALHAVVCYFNEYNKCDFSEKEKTGMKQLVKAIDDVNVQDSEGRTALHMAASKGNWDVIKLLLDSRAKADKKDKDGRTALHSVLFWFDEYYDVDEHKNGKAEIKQLIEAMEDVNMQDSEGSTALHMAASIENWDMMKFLLDRGAKADIKDKDGMTALHSVLFQFDEYDEYDEYQNGKAVMKQLIEAMVDVNVQDSQDNTALHLAASMGNWDMMKLLLDSGAKADIKDNDDRTALHSVLLWFDENHKDYQYENGKAVMKQLIESMEDVNVQDSQDNTALHLAASLESWHMMKLLLDSGAKADIKDNDGMTAIHHFLSSFDRREDGDIFKEEEAVWKQLMEVTDNVNVNLQDSEGRTALHMAASTGIWDLIKLLLDSGAKADMVDNDMQTIFHFLQFQSFHSDMRAMIERLFRKRFEHTTKETFLTSQCDTEQQGTLSSVLPGDRSGTAVAAVAEVLNSQDVWGRTALHSDMRAMHERLFRKLLEHTTKETFLTSQCDTEQQGTLSSVLPGDRSGTAVAAVAEVLNSQDVWGRTALHCAVYRRDHTKVELLLNHAANPNIQDSCGRTPLHCAALTGNDTAVRILLLYGARPDIQDKEGRTPWHERHESFRN